MWDPTLDEFGNGGGGQTTLAPALSAHTATLGPWASGSVIGGSGNRNGSKNGTEPFSVAAQSAEAASSSQHPGWPFLAGLLWMGLLACCGIFCSFGARHSHELRTFAAQRPRRQEEAELAQAVVAAGDRLLEEEVEGEGVKARRPSTYTPPSFSLC